MKGTGKKGRVGFAFALALMMLFAVPCFAAEEDVSPAPEENGQLVEENGHWHYYDENGVMAKDEWKTIDGATYYFKPNGNAATLSKKIKKDGKEKYYIFDEQGKLMESDGTRVVSIAGKCYRVNAEGAAVKGWSDESGNKVKASSAEKMYYFNEKGQALTGIQVIEVKYQGKFFQFKASGKINASKTKKLQKAAKYEANFAPLRKLLGKPKKTKNLSGGCYKPAEGKEQMLIYKNFVVYIFKYHTGKEIYFNAEIK